MELLYPNLNRRVKAVLIDTIIFVISLMTIVPLIAKFDISPNWVRIILILLPFFILEPFLVTVTGGSVGHHLMKIRVRNKNAEKKIGIISATVRFFVKTLLGLLSLFFILFTRKHQAFHDKIANSIVVFKNPNLVSPQEALKERVYEEEGYIYPSKWHRFFIFCVYGFVASLFIHYSTPLFISDACIKNEVCSQYDESKVILVGIFWILIIIYFYIKSMRGELYGCRRKKENYKNHENPSSAA